ncbi:hypothetical protein PRIPAC_79391 [Pristionchus pacificus]|uniref:Uncharacterized protein n=1 Tax=Pristionchus pacificus TaxID=54126 RepID=A0A2A6BWY5_PRIPA|nr:hypothetical protein PRIPAC_79391 [Pristionchus pacificus]|eukprot:PDM70512.1 hypothetical protein PRIPAC_46758 [Pristionchus pacificus]
MDQEADADVNAESQTTFTAKVIGAIVQKYVALHRGPINQDPEAATVDEIVLKVEAIDLVVKQLVAGRSGPMCQEVDANDLEAGKHALTAKVINAFVRQAVVARRGPMNDYVTATAEDERILKEKVKRAYAVRVVAAARVERLKKKQEEERRLKEERDERRSEKNIKRIHDMTAELRTRDPIMGPMMSKCFNLLITANLNGVDNPAAKFKLRSLTKERVKSRELDERRQEPKRFLLYEITELIEKVIILNTKDASANRNEDAPDDVSIMDRIPAPPPPAAQQEATVLARKQVPAKNKNIDQAQYEKPTLLSSAAQKQHHAPQSVAQQPSEQQTPSLARRHQQQIVSKKHAQPPQNFDLSDQHGFKEPFLPAREPDHSQMYDNNSVQPSSISSNAIQPVTLAHKPSQPIIVAKKPAEIPIVAIQPDHPTSMAQELSQATDDFAMEQYVGLDVDQNDFVAPPQTPTQPSAANKQDQQQVMAQKQGYPTESSARTSDVSMEQDALELSTPRKKRKLAPAVSEKQDQPKPKIYRFARPAKKQHKATIAAKKKKDGRFAEYDRRHADLPSSTLPNHSPSNTKKQDQSQLAASSQQIIAADMHAENVPQPIADQPDIPATIKQEPLDEDFGGMDDLAFDLNNIKMEEMDDFKLEDTVPLSDPILPESPPEEDPTAFYQHLFDAENDENAKPAEAMGADVDSVALQPLLLNANAIKKEPGAPPTPAEANANEGSESAIGTEESPNILNPIDASPFHFYANAIKQEQQAATPEASSTPTVAGNSNQNAGAPMENLLQNVSGAAGRPNIPNLLEASPFRFYANAIKQEQQAPPTETLPTAAIAADASIGIQKVAVATERPLEIPDASPFRFYSNAIKQELQAPPIETAPTAGIAHVHDGVHGDVRGAEIERQKSGGIRENSDATPARPDMPSLLDASPFRFYANAIKQEQRVNKIGNKDVADKENRDNSTDSADRLLNPPDASPFRFYANAIKQEQRVNKIGNKDVADKENRDNSTDSADRLLNPPDASPFRFYANAIKQEQRVNKIGNKDVADKENRDNSTDSADRLLNPPGASPFRFNANAIKHEPPAPLTETVHIPTIMAVDGSIADARTGGEIRENGSAENSPDPSPPGASTFRFYATAIKEEPQESPTSPVQQPQQPAAPRTSAIVKLLNTPMAMENNMVAPPSPIMRNYQNPFAMPQYPFNLNMFPQQPLNQQPLAPFTNYFPVKTMQPGQGDPSISNTVNGKQANVSQLKQSNRSTENMSKVQCDICSKWFAKKHLFYHKAVKHSDVVDGAEEHSDQNMSKVQCDICSKWFAKKHLFYHKAAKHGGRKFKCPHCPSTHPQPTKLRKHIKECHGAEFFQCMKCGCFFKTREDLGAHQLENICQPLSGLRRHQNTPKPSIPDDAEQPSTSK